MVGMKKPIANFMLPAHLKTLWVDALRSGEYEQGGGTLYSPITASFCCLGVLCVIAGYTLTDIEDKALPIDVGFEANKSVDEHGFGIHESPWSVVYNSSYEPLSHLNDARGLSFAVIADIIDEQVLTY